MDLDAKKKLTLSHLNNKGADQTALMRNLISAFLFTIWKAQQSNLLDAEFH